MWIAIFVGRCRRAFELRLCDEANLQDELIRQMEGAAPPGPPQAYREVVRRRLGRLAPDEKPTLCRPWVAALLVGACAAAMPVILAVGMGMLDRPDTSAVYPSAKSARQPGAEEEAELDADLVLFFSELTTSERIERLDDRRAPAKPRLELPALSIPLYAARPAPCPNNRKKPM